MVTVRKLCFASSTQGNRQAEPAAGPEHDIVGSRRQSCSPAPNNPVPLCVSSSVPRGQEPITEIKTSSLEDLLPRWITGHSLSIFQVEIRRCTETVHAGKNLMHLTQIFMNQCNTKLQICSILIFTIKRLSLIDVVPKKLDNQTS